MFTTTDKTLVSWFCFDEETPKHCSVVTVQAAEKYDALSFGQDAPTKLKPNEPSTIQPFRQSSRISRKTLASASTAEVGHHGGSNGLGDGGSEPMMRRYGLSTRLN